MKKADYLTCKTIEELLRHHYTDGQGYREGVTDGWIATQAAATMGSEVSPALVGYLRKQLGMPLRGEGITRPDATASLREELKALADLVREWREEADSRQRRMESKIHAIGLHLNIDSFTERARNAWNGERLLTQERP